jgi:hypothetical protein
MSNDSYFKYSCFISHCHGSGDLTKNFIEELKKELWNTIEQYLDQGVYIDIDRLEPGYKYNEELAQAICQSICMVVVYSPRYAKHSYCLREYTAMEILEERRLRLMEHTFPKEWGMIIPILFRGEEDDIPEKIREHIHFCDFRGYTTFSTKISDNKDYVEKIEKIAMYVYKIHKKCESSGKNLCEDCNSFTLPSEEEVKSWPVKDKPTLPFHEKDK